MKILFLGSATSREMVETLSGGSIAGNKMQVNVLENLIKYNDVKIEAITNLSIAAFPHDKALCVKKRNLTISNELSSLQIPFINLPIIKQACQSLYIYHEAKKIINRDNDYIVFSFNLFPQQGLPMMWLKKKFGCEVVSLLADLPIDEDYERRGISKILRTIFNNLTKKVILGCNNLIVLNKNAITQYAPGANYIVVDGGIDLKECDANLNITKSQIKNIVYSGGLVEYNGIINLVEAMNYVKDKSIELHIYGDGMLEKYVTEKADELPNVKYFGKINNEEMRRKQSEAWILINPRPVDDPIAKVTFPSKIFEYMLSGTPVLTTKLNGFTEDYFDKMFFIESNDNKVIAEKIDEIALINSVELKDMADKARNFVIETKSWDKQCTRIYDFLCKISR